MSPVAAPRAATYAGLALVFLIAFVASPANAQWTQSAGDGYAKLYGKALVGNKAFDTEGEVVDVADFSDVSGNLYLEYGLVENVTLFASSHFVGVASYDGVADTYAGAQVLGVRLGLLRGPLVAAVDVHVGGHPSSVADLTGRDDLRFDPSVVTRRVGWDLRLGTSFSIFWLSVSGGITNFSAQTIDPALMASLQFGASLPAGFVVEVHSFLRQPFGDVAALNVAGGGQTRYLGLGLGASWWFLDWLAVTASADSALFAESNAAAAPLTFGVEARF